MFSSMLFITVSLSGCLNMAGRMFTLREQMCEFDGNFNIQIDQTVKITLLEPILLEKDVYMIMDAKPTSRLESAEHVVVSYVFTQLQQTTDGQRAPTDVEVEFIFLFVPTDKGLALSEIKSNKIPAEILASALPVVGNRAEMAKQACHFSINPFRTSVMLEIDNDMLALLPPRRTLISWLGSSLKTTDNTGDLIYEFRLKGKKADSVIARINMDYDPTEEQPMTVDASFSRYSASIDIPKGTLRMKLY